MSDLPIRMIASDIDGTLIDRNGKMPEENLRAIREAQKKGIIFAIASGRYPENIYVMLRNYGIVCPISGLNGANSTDENLHCLTEHYMNAESASRVLEILLEAGSDYFLFAHHHICTARDNLIHHSEVSYGEEIQKLGFSYTHGAQSAREICAMGQVFKFFVCNNVPLPLVRHPLSRVDKIAMTQSGVTNIEVMPEGIDKAMGIRDLAARYHIPLSQVMTLGDQENDIPMLRAAGYGVAVGNASDNAKAAARFVTDTNENAGVAKAIFQWAL